MSQPNLPAALITADRTTCACYALRLCTVGSIDDSESTFVGRLLHDTENILADRYRATIASSQARGQENPDLSLLVGGLRVEREQGTTIDVAYRYFAADVRSFILADCPGHEQYIRNTVIGMSTAETVVLFIDARNGVMTQTRCHTTVAGLLGVRHVISVVNRIDLLDYNEEASHAIGLDVAVLAERLGLQNTPVVPVPALAGDNIIDSSEHTLWCEGPTMLELLKNLNISADLKTDAEVDLRLPVDYVIRDHATEYRGYTGRITASSMHTGDVVSVGANRQAMVTKITVAAEDIIEAVAGQSVAISLDAGFDFARDDLINDSRPEDVHRLSAVTVHLADKPSVVGCVIEVRYGAVLVHDRIASVDILIDIETDEPIGAADQLAVNDVAEITIEVAQPLPVDAYRVSGRVGTFLPIEPGTGDTLTVGLVRGVAQQSCQIERLESAAAESEETTDDRTDSAYARLAAPRNQTGA